MSTQAPAFQFYPQDFLVGTAIFTAEQTGAYIRFLCYQWEHGGLPDDNDTLARLGGCGGNAVASVRAKFELAPDGLLKNRRLEQIRGEQRAFRDRQSQNAKNRWEKRGKETGGNATASKRHRSGKKVADAKSMPDECQNDALHSSSSNSTPIVPTGDDPAEVSDQDPEWDEDAECCHIIWDAHAKVPRERSSKRQVRAEWDKIPKAERPDYDTLLDSLAAWRKTDDWLRENGKFVPAAHLWTKRRKWEHTPIPSAPAPQPQRDDADYGPLGRTLKMSEMNV